MKPIHQTKFGKPDGNCFQAAVASVLGVPLETVAHDTNESTWWQTFIQWLRVEHGLAVIRLGSSPHGTDFRDCYCIASGMGPRGLRHSVVWKGGAVVHDPHPSGDGLDGEPEEYEFFVPIDATITGPPSPEPAECEDCDEPLEVICRACEASADAAVRWFNAPKQSTVERVATVAAEQGSRQVTLSVAVETYRLACLGQLDGYPGKSEDDIADVVRDAMFDAMDAERRGLRVPQTPTTGVGAIFGKWPGDETDEEFEAAMAEERPAIAGEALRELLHEVDRMLVGGDDGPAEQCSECACGGVGYLKDAANKARKLLANDDARGAVEREGSS